MSKKPISQGIREIQCSCGKKFETYVFEFISPYDYICPDCQKNEWWWYATRMLKLEKFRCVKCTWKLTKKDAFQSGENTLWFKCKCCGFTTVLWFSEPY